MPHETQTPPLLAAALSSHRVWSLLNPTRRTALEKLFSCETATPSSTLLAQGQLQTRMGLILSGDVKLVDPDLGFEVLLHEGEMFGFGATPQRQLTTWQAQSVSACNIAWLAPDALASVCQAQGNLIYFFSSLPEDTPSRPVKETAESLSLLTTPIRTLIRRPPVTLAPTATIQATAQLMSNSRVSSVLLVDQDHLAGLITDRDLRNRVVAQGLDIGRPVSDIATLAPMTVSANSPAFEALLLMARHNIHHMPVMDGSRILGMITTTDLTEQHSTSAVYLAGDIFKQNSIEGLKSISGRIGQLQQNLSAAEASAYSTGHIITAIADAITVRLISLAEAQLGPPPVDYVWVAAGSQARNEQTAKSDQDNCLILDDSYDPALHGSYFKSFSTFVCDGLAECGYIHCPGEMMAMTDTWRQPQRAWVEYFRKWITQPKPKSLMLTCVFFDMRAIHGKTNLLENLQQNVAQQTKNNSLFLAHMVGNALKHRPPLGMFGQITLNKDAKHRNTIDLKHSAIVPIVDLARIYALAAGVSIANTHDRLDVSAEVKEITEQSARDLRDALEFLGKLRITHQARQTAAGEAPDNFLMLEELSNFERSHLKEAFSVVQTLQGVLQQRYSGGRF